MNISDILVPIRNGLYGCLNTYRPSNSRHDSSTQQDNRDPSLEQASCETINCITACNESPSKFAGSPNFEDAHS